MSWTNKERLSLAGAAGIQAALFWMFFHQADYLPSMPHDERKTGILLMHLVERVDAPSTISHPLLSALPAVTHHPDAMRSLSQSSSDQMPEQKLLFSDSVPVSLSDYLPAAMLTDKPSVVIDIDPELSRRFAFILPQSLELRLLINEYGDVDRVQLAGQLAAEGSAEALPSVLLEELMQRFLEARFLPGRLHGQAVRSALTIRISLRP